MQTTQQLSVTLTTGMIDLIKKGYFNSAKNILFLHTGGAPALYAYAGDFWGG
jgi:D-cysteine desulfhydrase